MRMLIDPRVGNFAWAVKDGDGIIVGRGVCGTLSEIRWLQFHHGVYSDQVWIDEAYRRFEVAQACADYGWNPVKGIAGMRIEPAGNVIAREIEEATYDA